MILVIIGGCINFFCKELNSVVICNVPLPHGHFEQATLVRLCAVEHLVAGEPLLINYSYFYL